jgi:hypothetical protein
LAETARGLASNGAGEAWRNPLVDMLARNAQRLPDWLGSSCPADRSLMSQLRCKALNPFSLVAQSESNRADIRYKQRKADSCLSRRFAMN